MHNSQTVPIADYKKKLGNYHNSIRSQTKQQYRNWFRNMFFIKKFQPSSNVSSIQNIQHLKIILQKHRQTGTKIDFSEINEFIISVGQALPFELEQKLLQLIFSNVYYLSDSSALSVLCNMANRPSFNQSLMTEELINNVIYKLIPANQIQGNRQVNMGEQFNFIENCQLICYLILIIKQRDRNNYDFSELSRYTIDIQNSCNIFCSEYLCMISTLSRNSSLLPSQRVIRQFLGLKIQQTKNQKQLYYIVDTLQNYIRQAKNQNIQTLLMYIKFISINLDSGLFPPRLKVEMINLFTALIRSSSYEAFDSIFEDLNTFRILKFIIMRFKFASMEYQKVVSILAIDIFVEKMNIQQLKKFLEQVDSVVEVLVEALQLSEEKQVMRVLLSLHKLLENIPNTTGQMLKHSILQKIRNLNFNSQESISIIQLSQCLYDVYFSDHNVI